MPPWTQVFAPQPDAFNLLDQAWRDAKSGAPQLVVLTGETGWGKTRTVQEWYAHLVQSEQARYWPPRIGDDIADRRTQVVPSIKDFTAESSAPMPFLYLGARADLQLASHAADGDNRRYGSREPLIYLKTQLGQHFFGIWAGKHGQMLNREMLVELAKQSFDNTPDLLSLLGDAVTTLPYFALLGLFKLRQWGELAGKFRTYQQNIAKVERELEISPAARAQRQDLSLVQELHLQLREVLRGDVEGVRAMPVVLFIDDAHAASPDTLRFLQTLVGEAIREKWPLLVIFTHWEREWQQDQAAFRPGDELTQAAHLPLCFDGKEGRAELPCHVYDLTEATPDFNAMLAEALPTLTEADRAFMIQQSGGHALFLVHLLRAIERDRKHFVGPEGLTELGRRKVRQFENFMDLARDRFDGLEDHVRQVLGWGSLAGMRFLHRVTRRLAADSLLEPVLSPDLHDTGVQAARAGAFVDPLDYEASEFDQVTFYRLALDYVGDLAEPESLRLALKRALQAEMATDGWRALPMPEQMDLLDIATRELRPTDPDPDSIEDARWASLAIHYGEMLAAAGQWELARDQYRAVAALIPEAGWHPDGVSAHFVSWCAQTLVAYRERVAPARLLDRQGARLMREGRTDRYTAAFASIRGDFDLQVTGDTASARARYEESLAIARRIVGEFGETPVSLRDLSVSLNRLGDFDLQVTGDTASARARYEESLAMDRRIVAEFGETPESLRDVSVSLERLGDFDLQVTGDTASARARYEESLAIRRRIMAEFGETPESLRDVSVSLNRLGDFDLRVTGDTTSARARYEESLVIARRIVAEFGETPESLRDVSFSLNKLGDFDLQVTGDTALARARYEESLAMRRRIVEQFGETPESIEDLALTTLRLADGDPDPAASWQEAYCLMRRRNRRFGPSVQSREWEEQLKADLAERSIPLPPDEA